MDHYSSEGGDISVNLEITEIETLSDADRDRGALGPRWAKAPQVFSFFKIFTLNLKKIFIWHPKFIEKISFCPPKKKFLAPSLDADTESITISGPSPLPEEKLTIFALRLAVLEKAVTGLGTLAFIWATVVLLGGFAVTLEKTDFWFITIILVIEGTRIFSRTHELEWQQQATMSFIDAGKMSFELLKSSPNITGRVLKAIFRPNKSVFQSKTRKDGHIKQTTPNKKGISEKWYGCLKWASSDYAPWVFLSNNIIKLLQCLQVASAIACVVLSLMKLIMRNYGEIKKGDTDKRNRNPALTIFYGLALAEASLFLLEKAYWEMQVKCRKLFEQVRKDCELGPSGKTTVQRFFYDAYSKCIDNSIFKALKMDMVSFAMELLGSNSTNEQRMGAQILRRISISKRYSDDTVQKIITSSAVERLVEMLNWNHPQEEEIRVLAALILFELARKQQNSLRVAAIPGSMESISSLLYVDRASEDKVEDGEGTISINRWIFNHHGLLLLKELAIDHDNCEKIGNTRGLLSKIIDLTNEGERILKDDKVTESQFPTVVTSLEVIKVLASTTGPTGKKLRQEIPEIVFTISNIRNILKHGEKHPDLRKLGIEILTSLAMEEDVTERIGGTGGILRELLNIMFKDGMLEDQTAAGKALAKLLLESKQNCRRILKLGYLKKLVKALGIPLLRVNAARILRNLCTYGDEDRSMELKEVIEAVPMVVKGIDSAENELQEAMVGLAARAFKLMTSEESSIIFKQARINEIELANTLVQILKNNQYPSIEFPRIRRYTIELAIWMMKDKQTNIGIFKILELEKELENVQETTSELESFKLISGTVGLSRYKTTMHSLVETAQNLLQGN